MLYQLSYASKFGGKMRRRANLSLRSLPDVRDNYLRYHKGKFGRNQPVCVCRSTNRPTGVILTVAVFQAERRILRADRLPQPETPHARSLAPLVRTRGFGMTQACSRAFLLLFSQGHHRINARSPACWNDACRERDCGQYDGDQAECCGIVDGHAEHKARHRAAQGQPTGQADDRHRYTTFIP